MLASFLRTVVKVAVASLIVGTILAHFGIGFDVLMKEFGLSSERVESVFRRGVAWLLPNIALGALVIVPVWLIAYILRPPGATRE
jgi:putative exporter of polyketide antibiotics